MSTTAPAARKFFRLSSLLHTRYRLAALFLVFLTALWLVVRLALLVLHGAWPGSVELGRILATGTTLDLLTALWVATPLVLALTLLPERWLASRAGRILGWTLFAAWIYGILFAAAAEMFFFEEFDSRFNFVAVNYLLYPTEVLTNIWESYPTGWILAGLGVLTLAVAWALRRGLGAGSLEPIRLRRRTAVFVAYALLLALATSAVPSELARGSGDRALDEIGGNGPYAFWLSLLGHDAPYEGFYAMEPEEQVRERLQRLVDDAGADPARGSEEPPAVLRRPRNVVIVLEESLGADFVGALRGDGETYTPSLDALAENSLFWTRAYSTGNRTIRAIEATTLSIAPLPGISLVRRSSSRNLMTLPEILRERGFQTLFVYGGRALFDGMGSYLGSNGVERIVEQGDFPDDAFRTAWGVADEEIFTRTLTELDRLYEDGRPFYSLVLTVSNHRPYKFPEDHVHWDHELDRRHNAVRYADWALGDFLRRASEHEFFEDTLFVLMGDHGARVYGAAEIPLPSYHVPILFYAPEMIRPGRISTLASSLDVPASVLEILGIPSSEHFFGHPLLADAPGGRALMGHNNEIALLEGGRMAVLGLHGRIDVFGCDAALTGCTQPLPEDATTRGLVDDAIAYYEGADLLYRSGELGTPQPPG